MPLKPGSSAAVKSENFDEFRHGKTFAHTEAKFGKARAEKQMVAAVLSNARRHPRSGTKSLHKFAKSMEK